jgi:hypothetical protein
VTTPEPDPDPWCTSPEDPEPEFIVVQADITEEG